MIGLGFEQDHVTDGIESLILDGCRPPVLRLAGFELWDFIHDVLPRPGRAGGVARFPINPRQMAAESRGLFVFILGRDEPKGLGGVFKIDF
jgi:hypothetical protein